MFSDSISEKSRHGITMSGMVRKNLPIMPGTNISGMKAATVVSTAKITGVAISRAPSMDPRRPSPCRSWWAWMFSPTMMASSTTMPSTRMKANSDMKLIVTPRRASA